jgi:putative transposase
MEKVAPSERFRHELDEVLAGVGSEEDPIETVGRLGARLILQQALEDEVSEFLDRSLSSRMRHLVVEFSEWPPRSWAC